MEKIIKEGKSFEAALSALMEENNLSKEDVNWLIAHQANKRIIDATASRMELDEDKVNYQELLFRYIIHWPWFVVSVLACLIGAWVYLHFQTPVYQVSASIMIKDDKKGTNEHA